MERIEPMRSLIHMNGHRKVAFPEDAICVKWRYCWNRFEDSVMEWPGDADG
jgi:hypothetical protein